MIERNRRRIVGRVAAVGLLLWALPVPAQQEPQQEEARPRSSYPALVHDFGEVARGDKLSHSFAVRNEGTAPLEIRSVHPT